MLLVHKQPNHHALLPAIHLSHRRNPSAPPLLAVQPTRTPGLLSLSKPRDTKRTQAPKQPRQRQPQPQPPSDDEKDLSSAARADSTDPAAPPPSAEKPRGRHNRAEHHPSQKPPQRSTSHAAPRPTQRSQADAAFSDSDGPAKTSTPRKRPQQQRTNTAPPSPTAAIGPPSGRLAKSRRARHKPTPSELVNVAATDLAPPAELAPSASATEPAMPLAVPQPRRKPSPSRAHPTLSRSVPLSVPSRKGFAGQKTQGLSDWDLPAASDREPAGDHTWQKLDLNHTGGPRTAPLFKNFDDPFLSTSPPPSPTVARRSSYKHQRSPSYPTDAMFTMSLDEDDMKLDDGQFHTPPRMRMKKAANRFLYAGSAFQNAPNPSELPPPKFLSTP